MSEKQRLCAGSEFTRSAELKIEGVNEKDRTAILSFSSEYPVMQYGMPEILCHDAGCVKLDRLREVGTLLYDHKTSIDCVLGPIMRAWVEKNEQRCKVKVRFDEDDDVEKVWRKVVNGTLRGTSFRGRVLEVEVLNRGETSKNGRFKGPATIVTQWEPIEVTITPIPADPSVGVGRSEDSEGLLDPLRLSRQRDLVLVQLTEGRF